MLKYLAFVFAVVYVCQGQDGSIPSGPALDKLMKESFQNLDFNNDTFVEKDEFESFVIIADDDDDGCMTLAEYKTFSAGTPDIATKIYQHFDTDNSNCITVDKVAAQFGIMDQDHNKKVTLTEFKDYYNKVDMYYQEDSRWSIVIAVKENLKQWAIERITFMQINIVQLCNPSKSQILSTVYTLNTE